MLPPAPPAAAAPAHVPALDGFRGLAVVLVVLSHFLEIGEGIGERGWSGLLLGGFIGVDMFFVLSGFLITGILLDCGIGRPGSYTAFYGRRLLRIFPLYLLALVLVAVLAPRGGDALGWYFAFASNLAATFKGRWLVSPPGTDLGHFWSLAVEEQFYLAWPFLVARLSRRGLEKLCLACALAGWGAHFLLHFLGNPVGAYQFTAVRLPMLAAGAWLAIVARDPGRWPALQAAAPRIALPALIATLVALRFPEQLSLMLLTPFLWGAALVMALAPHGPWVALLSSEPLVTLGRLSYGIYIFHYLAQPWLSAHLHEKWLVPRFGDGVTATLLFTALASALTLAAAAISWQLFEKPLLALKRHFPYPAAESIDSNTPPPSKRPPS